MSDLDVFPIALTGGVEDSKANAEPADFQILKNFTLFRGRFSLRAPFAQLQEGFLDDTVSPDPITDLLAAAYHAGELYVVGYSSVTSKAYLYSLSSATYGTPTNLGVVWSFLSALPRPVLASIVGGGEGAGTERLYIADYDQLNVTKFWDGSTMQTLQVDFNDSGSLDDVQFHYVVPFQFHLWGAGFQEESVGRPELWRVSQPGLIPAVDPITEDSTEWFEEDRYPIGKRGDKITSAAVAGSSLITYKKNQTYGTYGFDADSWVTRVLSENNGACGPYASCSDGVGLAYAWSPERGPTVTDGKQVIELGESVRRHVLEAEPTDTNVVFCSPDDGLIYFCYPEAGADFPNRWLAWDPAQKRFTEGEWLVNSQDPVLIRFAVQIPANTRPGPSGAPSSLVATASGGVQIDLTWANGDSSLETITEIWRGSTSGAETLFTTVGGGVHAYSNTGLTASTQYFYKVRHKRNGQFSSYSNEADDTTDVPIALVLATPVWSRTGTSAEQVALSFSAPPSGLAVQILVASAVGGPYSVADTTAADATSYVFDASGIPETVVFFRVRATDGMVVGVDSNSQRCWIGLLSYPTLVSYTPLGFASQWELVWTNTLSGATVDAERQDSSLGGYPTAWTGGFTNFSGTVHNVTQVCGPTFVGIRLRHQKTAFSTTDYSEWYEVPDFAGC